MSIIRIILDASKAAKVPFDEVFTIAYQYGICNKYGELTPELLDEMKQKRECRNTL